MFTEHNSLPHKQEQDTRFGLSHRTHELLEQGWNKETEIQLMALSAAFETIVCTPSLLWFQNYRDEEDMCDNKVIKHRAKARSESFEAWRDISHSKSDVVLQIKLLAQAIRLTDARERYRFAQAMHLNRSKLEQAIVLWGGIAVSLGAKKYHKSELIAALEHPNEDMLTYLLIYNFHKQIFIRNTERAENTMDDDRFKFEDPEGWKRMAKAKRNVQKRRRREVLKWYVQSGTFTPKDGRMPNRTPYAISPLSIAGRGTSYPEVIIGLQAKPGRAIVGGVETERWYIGLAHPITPEDIVRAERRGLPTDTHLRVYNLATKYDPVNDQVVTKWQVFNDAGAGEKVGRNWDEVKESNTNQAVEAFAAYLANPEEINCFPNPWPTIITENLNTFYTLHYLWTVSKGKLYQKPPDNLAQWYEERLKRCENASSRQDLITQDERLFTLKKSDFVGKHQENELRNAYPSLVTFAGVSRNIHYKLDGKTLKASVMLSIPSEGLETVEDIPTEPSEYEVGLKGEKVPLSWKIAIIKAAIPDHPELKKVTAFLPIEETNLRTLKEKCVKARDEAIERSKQKLDL